MDELEKQLAILRKIDELNKEKMQIVGEMEELLSKMCGVVAKMGQLQAQLIPDKPCMN